MKAATKLSWKPDHPVFAKRPFVVELVGPAGAGKTTLLRALCRRNQHIVPGIRFNKMKNLSLYLGKIMYWLPHFIFRYPGSRWFTWGELRAMVYLAGGRQALASRAVAHEAVTVLDHGPIFRLAMLHEFGPPLTKDRHYERWWNAMLARWASTLSLVIWLDASNEVLLQRIHGRGRAHKIKGKSEPEAYGFLVRYRSVYQSIIEKLAGLQGPALLRFDTAKQPSGQIADAVLAALETERKKRIRL